MTIENANKEYIKLIELVSRDTTVYPQDAIWNFQETLDVIMSVSEKPTDDKTLRFCSDMVFNVLAFLKLMNLKYEDLEPYFDLNIKSIKDRVNESRGKHLN